MSSSLQQLTTTWIATRALQQNRARATATVALSSRLLREVAEVVPELLPRSLLFRRPNGGVEDCISEALGDALIAAPVGTLPESALQAVDDMLATEALVSPFRIPSSEVTYGGLKDALWAEVGPTRLAVWRSDLLSLRVDAVVNAANNGGCG